MKKKSKKELLMAGGLALEILVVLLFLNARINALLDSDMSSEMVLAQLLAKENAALSTHWYYSTELRVLNTQLLYAFFFKLSNNWHWIRMASIICLWCIIIGIYYFWACAEGCKKYFLITALLLLAPISEDYFRFVLAGVYYIPHIAIAFAALAMNELYMKAQRGSRKLWLVVSVLLAFVAGLGGPREIIALYGPIGVAAAAELLNKKNKTRWQQFIYATFVGAAALLGYALNMLVLARIYHFATWGWLGFQLADGSRMVEIFSSFLQLFGARGTGTEYVFTCAVSVMWIVLTIGCIVYAYTHEVSDGYRRLADFTVAVYLLYFLLYSVTNMLFSARYGILNTVLSIPLLAMAANEVHLNESKRQWLLAVVATATIVGGALVLFRIAGEDQTTAQRDVTEKLLAEGYVNGYATFWNANVLTELSDGKIEVWQWCGGQDLPEHSSDIDDMTQWLQLASHIVEHPSGKVFALFTREEFESNPWRKNLHPEDVIYENEEYIVMSYPDHDTMKATLEKGL